MPQVEDARRGTNGSGAAPPQSNGGRPSFDEIGDTVAAQAEAQKGRAADRVAQAADAVRGAASGMRGQDDWMAGLVERGADELARMADILRTSDLRSLLNQAETLARRQPVLFAGAGAILGFALTRAARAGLAAATTGSATTAPRREAQLYPGAQQRESAASPAGWNRNGGSREH